jgi:spore maturation protein CgeB
MVEAVRDWFGRFPGSPAIEAVSHLAVPLQIENRRLTMGEVLDRVEKMHGLHAKLEDPLEKLDFQAALVWKTTLEYRRHLIKNLGPLGIRVFGDEGWRQILNGSVRLSPPVDYYRELPLVFNGSDVNFNATSLQMNLAVNQRVFDVAACGALLVTDYQPDMDELFDPEKEAVCYRDHAQALSQVRDYLRHPRERRQIAERSIRRVLGEHTYVHRLGRMIEAMRKEFGPL